MYQIGLVQSTLREGERKDNFDLNEVKNVTWFEEGWSCVREGRSVSENGVQTRPIDNQKSRVKFICKGISSKGFGRLGNGMRVESNVKLTLNIENHKYCSLSNI